MERGFKMEENFVRIAEQGVSRVSSVNGVGESMNLEKGWGKKLCAQNEMVASGKEVKCAKGKEMCRVRRVQCARGMKKKRDVISFTDAC